MSEVILCPDCGSGELYGPDFEGFMDCSQCGAAFLDYTRED